MLDFVENNFICDDEDSQNFRFYYNILFENNQKF